MHCRMKNSPMNSESKQTTLITFTPQKRLAAARFDPETLNSKCKDKKMQLEPYLLCVRLQHLMLHKSIVKKKRHTDAYPLYLFFGFCFESLR